MTQEHEQNLEFYECTFDDDDSRAFVTADLNLRATAPQKDRPILLMIDIPLRDPRENGLPKNEESSRLYDLEEKIEKAFRKDQVGVLAGMRWRKAVRRLYYYCADNIDLSRILEPLSIEFPPHEYSLATMEDPNWEVFMGEVYPNGLGMQYISDRRTLETLQKQGDALTPTRDVRHWAYFPDESARGTFISQIEKKGFSQIGLSKNETDAYPFGASFSRTDSMTFKSISRITAELWVLANNLRGQYDGWECPVTKG